MVYSIGQIIYLLSNKETKIFPAQVVEVVLRKTLDGEETNYFLKMPDTAGTVVSLDKVSADVFLTPEDLKSFMLENARKNIETVVINSQKLIEKYFVSEDKSDLTLPALPEKNEDLSNIAKVDLGNGITARVNLDGIGSD